MYVQYVKSKSFEFKVALWNEVSGSSKLITTAAYCQNGKNFLKTFSQLNLSDVQASLWWWAHMMDV